MSENATEQNITEQAAAVQNTASKKSRKKLFIIIPLAIVAILIIAFAIYVNDYYHMDDEAASILSEMDNMADHGDYIVLNGNSEGAHYDPDTAIIFYPGGKVEYTSYLPLLKQLQDQGVTSVLVKMPFNLAFFKMNAADDVIADMPEIKNWVIMGHSLGGVAASSYYANHEDQLSGMILLGSYIYGDVSDRSKCLVIYGTEDVNLDLTQILDTDQAVVIEGGNHCQFGNYGFQDGDGQATISRQDQQDQAVQAILAYLDSLE